MTAIVSGSSLGLFNSSLSLLGTASGSSLLGKQGERLYVNAATGNLVVQAQDEYLASMGLDTSSLVRTYNSQGLLDGDNNDHWRIGFYRRIHSLTGTVNTMGSTVTKTFGDGAEVTYTYDSTVGSATYGFYVSGNGDGTHDTLSYHGGTDTWAFQDGNRAYTETFEAAGGGSYRLISQADADLHPTTYHKS
jgi:hypothetical protein